MLLQLSAALAISVMAGAPADSAEPPTAKEVRQAERQAKTATDHLRLAA